MEGFGDGFVATERGEDGGEGAEVGEQVSAGTAGQEAQEEEAVLGFGPEVGDDRARQGGQVGGQPVQQPRPVILVFDLAGSGQRLPQGLLFQGPGKMGSQPRQPSRCACRRTMALSKLHDIPQTFRGVIAPQEIEH